MKESQTHTRLFNSHKFLLLAILGLFTDGKKHFPTRLYTSTSETPTLSYTWDLKKVPPSGRSLSQGWVLPPGVLHTFQRPEAFRTRLHFYEPSFLIHLVHCAPSFIIIGIPFSPLVNSQFRKFGHEILGGEFSVQEFLWVLIFASIQTSLELITPILIISVT